MNKTVLILLLFNTFNCFTQSVFNLSLNRSSFCLSDSIELYVENITNDTQYFHIELLGSSDSGIYIPLYQDILHKVPGLTNLEIKLSKILPNVKLKYNFPIDIIVKNPNYNNNLKFFYFNIIYNYAYSPYNFSEKQINFLLIRIAPKRK